MMLKKKHIHRKIVYSDEIIYKNSDLENED